jgi:hypothetical protein
VTSSLHNAATHRKRWSGHSTEELAQKTIFNIHPPEIAEQLNSELPFQEAKRDCDEQNIKPN